MKQRCGRGKGEVRMTMAGWEFSEVSVREAVCGERLLNPSLDLGNPCNLNCPYCFIEEKFSGRKVRKDGELTFNEIRGVLEDLIDGGAETINLVGAGEPTIDPQFREVVEFVRSKGVRTVLFTNGVRLSQDRDLVHFLAGSEVTVVLKYNSMCARVQDAVVGQKGYTKSRDLALRFLEEEGFNRGLPTRLAFDTLVFKGNVLELPFLYAWCQSKNIEALMAEFIPTGRTANGSVVGAAALESVEQDLRQIAEEALQPITQTEREWLLSTLEPIGGGAGVVGATESAYYGGGQCTQSLGVYVDILGRVWPCVARSSPGRGAVPLGSIRAGDKASDIWKRSPVMKRVRAGFDGGCQYKAPLVVLGHRRKVGEG